MEAFFVIKKIVRIQILLNVRWFMNRGVSNCIDLHPFCTSNHRSSFPNAISIKWTLLSSLRRWNHFITSAYLRLFYRWPASDNFQYDVFISLMPMIIIFPTSYILTIFTLLLFCLSSWLDKSQIYSLIQTLFHFHLVIVKALARNIFAQKVHPREIGVGRMEGTSQG